jgi:hypothetical protein
MSPADGIRRDYADRLRKVRTHLRQAMGHSTARDRSRSVATRPAAAGALAFLRCADLEGSALEVRAVQRLHCA